MNEIILPLPITTVTAFEDRAELVRVGSVKLPGGPVTLRIEDVSPLLVDNNVVALIKSDTHVTLDETRVERAWTRVPHPDAAHLPAMQLQLELAQDNAQHLAAQLKRAQERRSALLVMVTRVASQSTRALWTEDRNHPLVGASMDTLHAALNQADEDVTKGREEFSAADQVVAQLRATIQQRGTTDTRLKADIVLRMGGDAGEVQLTVTTLLPCALWRPSHEAHLLADGAVEWTTHATVWNRSLEAWKDVELVLSTARPGAGAELPQLRDDVLVLRQKTAEERKTIVVEHREEAASRDLLKGAAPGVYDGGIPRAFKPASKVSIPPDGRPHRVAVGSFKTAATSEMVAMPEVSKHVFLRASLRNVGGMPLLAGPVTLIHKGNHVGEGDIKYVGPGESLDVSFGSDDRFVVRYERSTSVEKRALLKNITHFVQRAEISLAGMGAQAITLMLRMPVSELKQLKVLPSPAHCTEGAPAPDADGLLRIPLQVRADDVRKVELGFHFDAASDVQVPDPW